MEAATQRISLNRCSWKVKKPQKNTCEKVHVHVYFSKVLQKLSYFYPIFMEKNTFKEQKWIKIRRFLKQKIESFAPNKTTLYFWLKINFRKMASNKHIKGERRGDIWQWQKNLEPQYHSILPLIQYPFTTFELQAK